MRRALPAARRGTAPAVPPRAAGTDLPLAAGLAAAFMVGDRLVRRLLPSGGQEIGDIYALRDLRPRAELVARLGAVIGPAEELFWRGFVNERLVRRYGRWPGAALGAAAYGGAHVATGNFTLFGAAGVAGAYWSALAAAGMPMGALVVSHVAWDLWAFLVAPTSQRDARGHVAEQGSATTAAGGTPRR